MCQNQFLGKGRLVGGAASERQSALSSMRSRAFPKTVAKSCRVWLALGRAKSFGGGQIVAVFL